ncbi:UNVERIFIED_CONTAM: hypothetical protein FKN15_016618, partial [Acipenser sinensis]
PSLSLSFSADTQDDDSFKYYFSVCGNAANTSNAGLVQIDKSGIKTITGRYTETQIFGGSDWVILVYKNGSKYDNHCNNETRKSMVMISCNRNTIGDGFAVIDEVLTKPTDCFYLFELDSSTVCPMITSKLNAGSILLIVSALPPSPPEGPPPPCRASPGDASSLSPGDASSPSPGVAEGPASPGVAEGPASPGVATSPAMQQEILWLEPHGGELLATKKGGVEDGCDFICRSRARNASPTYRGVASEPLGGEETEERDDHLLPM